MTQALRARAIVVDDHKEMALLLGDSLKDAGYDVVVAERGEDALADARKMPPDVVLTDLKMSGLDGLDVMRGVHAIDPSIPVIIMTAFGAIESAIEAMRLGAFHYLTKPFKLEEVGVHVERALADRRLRDENRNLRRTAGLEGGVGELTGRAPCMRMLFDLLERVAWSDAPVLIRGESGSGKDLVARALHFTGARKAGPYVPVNCTTLPEQLLESELFGHIKGSFTGASSARRGLFVEAHGGTLFLDEIGDMPPGVQAKLLRVLEDGEVRPIGSDSARKVDVRIVAATHQDLEAKIKAGEFRADLFYRLNVVIAHVPPLRDRIEDLPQLVDTLFEKAKRRNPRSKARGLSPELLARFTTYPWPGNVRELENIIERLLIVCDGESITIEAAAPHLAFIETDPSPLARAHDEVIPLRRLESEYIAWAVRRCDGNKTRAAELLGIDVSTIHRRERDRG